MSGHMSRKIIILLVLAGSIITASAALLVQRSLPQNIHEYSPVTGSKTSLESLQAGPYVTRFLLPSRDSGPWSILADKEGRVWIAERGIPGFRDVGVLALFDPKSNSLVEYTVPGMSGSAEIWGMVASEDGKIWFTEAKSNSIWRFDPLNLKFTQYVVPTQNSFPLQLAFDRAGKVWFTEDVSNKIGVLDPQTRTIEEFAPPGIEPTPVGLAFDDRGRLWITLAGRQPQTPPGLARFDPITKQFAVYDPPAQISLPTGIAVDDSQTIWFTQHLATSKVSRLFPSNGTMIDYVTSGTPLENFTLPFWVSRDDSGQIWFNEHYGNKIAKLDPSTGTLVEYIIPWPKISYVVSFSLAESGKVWFVEWLENRFGVIDTSAAEKFEVKSDVRTLTLLPGSKSSLVLSVSALHGGEFSLGVTSSTTPTGQLSGISAQFSTPTISIPDGMQGQVTLSLSTDATLKPGSYTLTVTASNEFQSRSVILQLIVKPRT